jgi:uncharacterized protein YjbI with pentapeptide repeats
MRALFSRWSVCVTLLSFAAITLHAADTAQVEQLKNTRACSGCDLTDAQLGGLQLQRSDLTAANLSGAHLYMANLRNANLTGASLVGADLTAANLEGAKGADLSGATTSERTTCPNGKPGPCR